MTVDDANNRLVKSAARALDIVELLAAHSRGLTLSQIAEHLDIPLSSLHGLATTLVQKDYVVRDEPSLTYRLGPKISQLAASYRADNDIISLADPIMVSIRDRVGETTSLAILQDDVIVFTHKQPASGAVQVVNPVGTRLPAHATGSGKVLLAYLPEEEIEQLYPGEELDQLTPSTIDSKTELKEALAEIRRTGYAYDEEESQVGVWAVAAGVRDEQGAPVAALSIVGPSFRIMTKNFEEWSELIVDGAKRISSQLGFRSDG